MPSLVVSNHNADDSHHCYEPDRDAVRPFHDLLLMVVIRLQVIPHA